uniref:p1-P2 n=1 Tax=Beet mild yellowing virus TaxID=156690 RepID=Q45GB9_9VIRU|nr:P1-P2 [Beet mild yellowing virus]
MKTAFVLFSLLCLCCLVSSSTLGASFTLPGNASLYDWPGSTITAEPLCPALATLTYECPPEKTLKDFTLPEIQAEIWGRGYNAVEKFSFTVKQSLKSSFQYGVLKAKENYGRALRSTLKWIVLLWSYVIWALSCTAWYLLKNYTIEILMLSSLFAFTTFLVKLAVWIFGGWLTSLVNGLFALTKRILKTLSSRKSYVCERSVKGFLTFTIKQSPPRNCILQIQHADGSHAGYATCVTLFDGTNGLLTAQHVVDDFYEGDPKKTLKVVSTRNGNKIPLDEFRVTYTSEKRDQLLMHGPPNWEGVLACKAVHMIPASSVAKSKATFFALSDGEWHSSNAELVGTSKCGKFISVLSDTKSGHSGTPYFNGKSVLGVHIGSPKEFESENVNYMSPIPRFPGLTSPNYIFETTALAGKFFSQEEVEELMEDFSLQEIYSIATARGKYIKYEACPDEETFHDVLTESSPMQGGRKGGSDRRNNRKRKHPREIRRKWKKPSCCSFYTAGTLGENCTASHVHCTSKEEYDEWPRCWCQIAGHDCHYRSNLRDKEGSDRQNGFEIDRETSGRDTIVDGHEEAPLKRAEKIQEQAKQFGCFFKTQYHWERAAEVCPGFIKVGELPKFYFSKQKGCSDWGTKLTSLHPELEEKTRGFGWPKFGPAAELKSLRLQAARWLERAEQVKIPSTEERERVIEKCVEAFSPTQTRGPMATRGSKLSWNNFLEDFKTAVFSLELEAGVGVPYVAYGRRTHRGWIEDPDLLPVLARFTFDRLQKLSEAKFEHMSPEQLVQEGLCDPIRLFVKGEPHKQSKLDEGRYRLIMSVSLVDQLVARVLFQNQNKREIALWRAIPSKPGFGLSTDGQVVDFMQALSAQVGVNTAELLQDWKSHLIPTDCSGFDWSVSDWLLEDEMEVRNRLTLDINDLTRRLRAGWLKCLANSVLCLSDGTLLSQQVPGVQKSGSYNTSSSNSRIRVMAAYHSGASWAIAMGDDALESVDADLSRYSSLGFKVEVSSQLEFCSHIFEEENLAVPVNKAKMLYKLIHGYEPECGNLEVLTNYLAACFSILNELRSDPELVAPLYQWLVLPVQPQKI